MNKKYASEIFFNNKKIYENSKPYGCNAAGSSETVVLKMSFFSPGKNMISGPFLIHSSTY
jgi:hypothetical protein